MNKANNVCEWGFDLTDIKASDWKFILNCHAISTTPVHDKDLNCWLWKGTLVTIHTGNDPISGKYATLGRRDDEKNYASYIGIYGNKALVETVAELIRKFATSIKDETPYESRFI